MPPTLKLLVTVSEPVTVVLPVIDVAPVILTGPLAVIALPAPLFVIDTVGSLPVLVATIALPDCADALNALPSSLGSAVLSVFTALKA